MNKRILKQLSDARKHVKLMAKQFGRESKQYQDAMKQQVNLVVKQMIGK